MNSVADIAVRVASASAPRFRLLGHADLDAMPPIQWLVKNVLPAQGLAQVYGASQSGKSFLTLDMACAVAEGRDWFGFRVRQAPVCYLALEGEAGFKLRTQAWCKHQGRHLPDQFFMVMQQPFQINEQRDVLDLAQAIPLGALTVVDTQNRAAPAADENSSKDMGEILRGAKTIADITKGVVLLIAHTGKDDSKGVRGHSSQLAAMDASIVVRRNSNSRSWTLVKSKEGSDGDEHSFKLNVVDLGTDTDGDPLTSCVVRQTAAKKMSRRLLTDVESRAVRAYVNACEAGDGRLDDEGRRFIGLHLEDWRGAFYRANTAGSPDTKRKAFSRVRESLVADALATVADDIYRIITPDVTAQEMHFPAQSVRKQRDIEEGSGTYPNVRLKPAGCEAPGHDEQTVAQ